jgi:hypothetical protein
MKGKKIARTKMSLAGKIFLDDDPDVADTAYRINTQGFI